MEYNTLNKNAKKAWTISSFITLILVGGILLGLRIFFNYKIRIWRIEPIINIILIFIIISLLLEVLVYPTIKYKQWRYVITEDRIEFVRGIYFLTTTIIPIVRIQHIDVEEGPIDRIYKLAKIHIHTAGGQHEIEGLPKAKAKKISEYIKDRIEIRIERELEIKKQDINNIEEVGCKDGTK